MKGGESGPAILPGRADHSLLIKAIEYKDATLAMPPSGKLTSVEIADLKQWINEGAKWPRQPAIQTSNTNADLRRLETHWAWQPLKRFQVPSPKNSERVTNEIDRFVLNLLEMKGLKAPSEADRPTLIRRAYLDLIGIPPTKDAVLDFTNDRNPSAYEKLIDRLLDSPHYGERWGRYWLDVARYSDGLGGFLDGAALPDAWRYRDWVVKSLNEDRSYKQFVIQQLAGDLIGDANAAIGTGFLAVGPTYNDDGGDPDSIAKAKAETLDDRVDTVTRAFLGLTVACARCHDHKFDPIPQTDYYSVAGVFNNTRLVHQHGDSVENVRRFEEHRKTMDGLEGKIRAIPRVGFDCVSRSAIQLVLRNQLRSLQLNTPLVGPKYHGVLDSGSADMAVAIRGDLRNSGKVVPRRYLSVIAKGDRPIWKVGSGRLQLAEAIVSTEIPIAARVIVNRVWQGHFGKALVRTPENFGTLGESPTHPELLEWLVGKFIAANWSLKSLHKTIMLSSTYRFSSKYDESNYKIDGDNRYLWRMNPRKLDVEAWRDCMMFGTGELELSIGGPPVGDILNSRRRTLYAAVSRNGDRFPSDAFLRLFDFPSARSTIAERSSNTIPQQYLFLLNSEYIKKRSKALVAKLKVANESDSDRIEAAYWFLFSRAVSQQEKTLGLDFLGTQDAEYEARWLQYAQMLLSSNELMQIR